MIPADKGMTLFTCKYLCKQPAMRNDSKNHVTTKFYNGEENEYVAE